MFESYLKNTLLNLGIARDDIRIEKLVLHYNYLMKFNKIINLTSLTDPKKIAYRLFADSLLPLDFLLAYKNIRILDTGPGGGFPSIPLRIFTSSEISFTLIEKRKKAVFFLEELISSLSLDNIKVVSGRIEEFIETPEFLESFDIALNKAVFKGDIFLSLVKPFLNENGRALIWTKRDLIKKHPPGGWEIEKIIDLPKPELLYPGVVVVYTKKAKLDEIDMSNI